ncbi:MAG: alpha-amylase family glycosyl hydrolase [Anaerolineae bacterium]
MDFVFGTMATPELRLLHHRIARTGVQHTGRILPYDPLPGEAVMVKVVVGQDVAATHAACYYTTDGSVPEGQRGHAVRGDVLMLERVGTEWDTPTMSYATLWQGTLPAQPEGTLVRYRIGAWSDGKEEAFADYPDQKPTTERAASAFFQGLPMPDLPPIGSAQGQIFNYGVDRFETPAWAKTTIMYHIFVDRFYPGDGKSWNNAQNVSDFYGGTLWGVRDKLDYIEALGADSIWLSPIFPSNTHHGYDATDYAHVEPRMGGDEALHALVDAAHQRGIRVILDLAANHLSHEHPYFQDALHNADSPYRQWFTFDDSPEGYETFFGVRSMPIINLKNEGARNWMLETAQYWLREFKIDGFRLDHANGPNPNFWTYFRAACREVNPECYLFGEVVEAPDILRTYVGRLDGLLDFYLEVALRQAYGWGTLSEPELETFLAHHSAYFPPDLIMPSFLDNHDLDRFLFIVNGDKEKLRRAVATQMKLPNPPIIYYGTEVGLSQNSSHAEGIGLEESRLPMLWGEAQDKELLAFYKQQIKARRQAGL